MIVTVSADTPDWDVLEDMDATVERAVTAALSGQRGNVDVLLTSDAEVQKLNRTFRNQDKPTNVLSFPSPDMPLPEGELPHIGDIVLAFETVKREAAEARKPLTHHVTHLVVHATLHLQGHDHETDADADVMEQKERDILAGLGIADPYAS
jgi:probable rRNA maturation factor